jgi:hypothetical protein
MAKGSQIDPAWDADNLQREFADELGLDVQWTVDEFRDYWVGTGRAMVNWNAVWRNWCRKKSETKGARPAAKADLLSADTKDSTARRAWAVKVRRHPGVFNPDANSVAAAMVPSMPSPCTEPGCIWCKKMRPAYAHDAEWKDKSLSVFRRILAAIPPPVSEDYQQTADPGNTGPWLTPGEPAPEIENQKKYPEPQSNDDPWSNPNG